MTRRFTLLATLAVASVALVVTGCGSDDAAETTTTTAAPATDDSGDDAGDDETTTTADDSGDSGSEPMTGMSEECTQLSESFTSLDVQGMSSAFQDGTDPTQSFKDFAAAMEKAEANAPADISADVAAVADGYAELAEASEGIDWSKLQAGDPSVTAEAGRLMQTFNSEDFAASAQRISEWINANCVPDGMGG